MIDLDLSVLNITPGCILVYRTDTPDLLALEGIISGLTVEIGAIVALRPAEDLTILGDDDLARMNLQRIPPK